MPMGYDTPLVDRGAPEHARVVAAQTQLGAPLASADDLRVRLFSYGTLRLPAVQVEHFGRPRVGADQIGRLERTARTAGLLMTGGSDWHTPEAGSQLGDFHVTADELLEALRARRIGVKERMRFDGTVALDRSGAFGYTVRVVPRNDRLVSDAELGLHVGEEAVLVLVREADGVAMLGGALLRDGPVTQAAVRATLDAVNRRLMQGA